MSSSTYLAYYEGLPDEAKKRYNAKLDKIRTVVDDTYAMMPSAQPGGTDMWTLDRQLWPKVEHKHSYASIIYG